VTLSELRGGRAGVQVTRHNAGLQQVWLASMLWLAAVVGAVWLGLPLPLALSGVTLAPLLVIVMVERGAVRRPELFTIR
jgi:Flp pilus assembly protein TadB